jgi:D-sedoheptulose 7-phosphate isomerase
MADRSLKITEFLEETIALLKQLDSSALLRAEQILLHCYHRHGRVYTLGNGGSASTAQHFACDLAKYVIPEGGRPFDVRCLTDNVALYTAWANDAVRNARLRAAITRGPQIAFQTQTLRCILAQAT